MPERRPVYARDGDGWFEDMLATDTMTLGGLTLQGDLVMGGNKVTGLGDATSPGDAVSFGQAGVELQDLSLTGNLDMNGNTIENVATPTIGHHGVNKDYVDDLTITGGKLKEVLLHRQQLDDVEGIRAAVALTMQINPSPGDTITIVKGALSRVYGAQSGGDLQYSIGATVADSMTNLVAAIQGDSSAAWGAYFTLNLESIDSDGVVVVIEDSTSGGLLTIFGTWATQADVEYVDFTGEHDYEKKTLSILPVSDPGTSNFGFRRVMADLLPGEYHHLRELDEIFGWDADDEVWQQRSGGASIPDATSAPGGGIKGKITVDSDYGLNVVSGILRTDLSAIPGLEFSSGDLQAKVDPVGGIQRIAAGLAVKIDDTPDTLDADSDGLKVVGIPSLFKINGTPVSSNVTAANLDELHGGGPTILHSHASSGSSSNLIEILTAGETVAAGDPVSWGFANDRFYKADANSISKAAAVFGIAMEPIIAGATGLVIRVGIFAGALSGATIGTAYFLATGGGLVTSPYANGSGQRNIRCGFATSATDLEVQITDFGRRAGPIGP